MVPVRTEFVLKTTVLGLVGGFFGVLVLIGLTSLGVVAVESWFAQGGALYHAAHGTMDLSDASLFYLFVGLFVIASVKLSARLSKRNQGTGATSAEMSAE